MPGSFTSVSDDDTSATNSVSVPLAGANGVTAVGIGLSNPKLSSGRRQMLDLVNKLHSTGVQVDIDLPQIAVIGSQSAGKSSLIESISGITLPRASGTCTRCPTECRLSRKDTPWQCIVSLRFIVDPHGQPLGQARNVPFGDIIYDKREVEDRIRRAQQAILNPTRPPKDFLISDNQHNPHETEVSFSSNCVSIQISGPDVADLSFCDLPGLIATASSSSKGGADDVKLIVGLAESYIKKESCIILLTVTCETDFENQPAHGLAKKWDPHGQRTIGVLTKPDRIPLGDEANWLLFIRNEREPLKNNWFCVKQPSSSDLKAHMTWELARKSENDFFAATAPWSDLDGIYQKYLRTNNLVERLSVILSDLILKRIPEIEGELERSISVTRRALEALPTAPSANPQSEVAALLHKFTSDLARHVEGVPSRDGLLQAIRPAQDRFRRAIRETAPNFRPFESRYEGVRHISPAGFLVDEEGTAWDGEDSDAELEGPGVDRYPIGIEDASRQVHFTYGYSNPSLPEQAGGGLLEHRFTRPKIYIDEVMEKANESLTRELPGHYPYTVHKMMIEAIILRWEAPAIKLCETVHIFISDHVKALVNKHFTHFGQGTLAQRVRVIMNKHIQDRLRSAREKIKWLLSLEAQPFSLNTHYFTDYRTKFLTHYRGQRHRYAHPELKPAIEAFNKKRVSSEAHVNAIAGAEAALTRVMSALAEMKISASAEQLQKLLAEDEMEPALFIMADVRAYFQVAYKRLSDTVPLAIDHELVRGVGAPQEVLETLYTHLGMNDRNGYSICQELAQESPQIADKRADLEKKLERLEGAHNELLHLSA